MVFGQFVMTLLMVITPLHMDYHAHSTWSISWVIMGHALGMFGISGITGRLIQLYGQKLVILIGMLILLISCLIVPVSPKFLPLALALFLFFGRFSSIAVALAGVSIASPITLALLYLIGQKITKHFCIFK